jgi:hypothetical protein
MVFLRRHYTTALILVVWHVLAISAFAQNVRVDISWPSVSSSYPPVLVANVPPNAPIVHVCAHPANQVPCTNYVTTYTSLGVACPNGSQDTPQPQPSACQPTGDNQGNIGFWIPSGTYDLTVCVQNNCGDSPFTITPGGTGGGGQTYTAASPLTLTGNTFGCPSCGTGTGNVSLGPSATQPIVQPVATSFSANNLANIRYVLPSYNWSRNPTGGLVANTPATVTLAPCPLGIFGSDSTTNVYIFGVGTPEVVQMTGGGSCVPGSTGTITFTPLNTHNNGYAIGSASSGIQETITDAATNGTGAVGVLYHVVFPPSNPASTTPYVIRGRVNVPQGYADIDVSGAMIDCEAIWDTCFFTNAANVVFHGIRAFTKTTQSGASITQTSCSANVSTITTTLNPPVGGWVDIQWTDNPHYWGIYQVATSSSSQWTFTDNNCTHGGTPGAGTIATASTPGGNAPEHAFLEDNGFSVTLRDFYYDFSTFAGHNFLNSVIVVDGDQNFLWDNGDIDGGTYCGPDYCGQVLYGPGGPAGTPLGTLSHVSMTINCFGNGVKWLAGQGLVMTGFSVIQGFAQYGLAAGPLRGSSGPTMLDGLYEEVGGCYNPFMIAAGFPTGNLSSISAAGAEQFSAPLYLTKTADGHSPSLQGFEPNFSNAAGGTTNYEYWLVINDGSNASVPLRFGDAQPTSSASYAIGWPRYASQTGSTVTYQVLRTSNTVGQQPTAPFGTATNALTSSPIAQCSAYICTMNDSTTTTLQSYTVATNPALIPELWNFPGTAVLGGGALMYSDSGLPAGSTAAGYVTTLPNQLEVFALNEDQPTPGVAIGASNMSFAAGGQTIGLASGATLMPNSQSITQPLGDQLKGRLNFLGFEQALYPQHLVTLHDSNPYKTIANAAHRPLWDANDVYLGFDSPAGTSAGNAQLSIGAPGAISQYIANTGDNKSWGERLTSAGKFFQTPITDFNNLTVLGNTAGVAFPFTLSGTQVSNVLGSATGWTTNGGSGAACNISGGSAVLAVGSDNKVFCSYTNSTFANSQYIVAQITALGSIDTGIGVRMSNSAETGYFFLCLAASSSVIYKYVAGAPTAITSGGTPCAINDYLLLEISGSSITAMDITQGFTLTGTDSSLTSGYPGLASTNISGGTWANLRAGNLTYSSTQPVTINGMTLSQTAGVPTANCNIGDLDSNSSASSASTVLYVCYPSNTWSAIAVP